MTTEATPLRAEFTGNNAATSFPYDWKVRDKTHVLVTRIFIATEAETPLAVDADFNVTGVGNPNGGTIAFIDGNGDPIAPTSAYRFVATSIAPDEQPIDFTTENSVPPDRVEDGLDYLCILVKQLSEKVSRAVLVGIGQTAIDMNTFIQTILGYRNDSVTAAATAVDARDDAVLAAAQLPLSNYSATTPPTVNDDSGDGYGIGSKWYDLTAKEAYTLLDATVGAANWQKSTLTVDELAAGAFMAKASQAQAVAGSDNDTVMTPLRTRQAYGIVPVNTYTNDRVLDATDIGALVAMNKATAVNVTTQTGLPAGAQFLIEQANAGQVTVVQGVGTTVNQHTFFTKKTRGQYSQLVLTHKGGEVYTLAGHLEMA